MQQFAVLSTAIAAFALGCNGAVLGSRDFIKAEFRLYSGTDCFAGNLGFVEAFNETLGVCGTFSDQVYSVNVLVADNGCTVYTYDDQGCTAGRRALPVGECQVNEDGAPWMGYMVECATDASGN